MQINPILLLSLPAVFLSCVAWSAYRNSIPAKMLTAATILGVGYWYVFPGTFFLLGLDPNSEDAYLLEAENSIYQAILLTHSSFLALLLLPALALGKAPSTATTITRPQKLNFGRLDILLLMAVASAIGLFATRFAAYGTDYLISILIGLANPRELMSFENFSSGAAESLMALWDIVNIFLSVFFVGTLTWQRHTFSVRFVAACFIAVMSFLATGTRSVILLILCATAIASICRPSLVKEIGVDSTVRPRVQGLITLFLIGGLTLITGIGITTRFESGPDADSDMSAILLVNSVGVHNDMFRELVYVLDRNFNSNYEGINFLLTPITFTMPTFLGFSKSLPTHLVDFNIDRAGIDLINGSGNVFPGLLADMFMCFSVFSPIVLLASGGILCAALLGTTIFFRNSPINSGLLAALLSYYFISFRNVQGSFGILLIAAALLQIFLAKTPWGQTVKRKEPIHG